MANDSRLNYFLAAALVLAVGGAYLAGRRGADDAQAPPPALPPGPVATGASGPGATPALAPAPPPGAPSNPDFQRAGQAIARQDWPAARAALEKIPPGDPAYPSAIYNLGILLEKTGKFAESIAALQKALEFDPGNTDAWASLGWSAYRSGDLARAELAFLRAIELDAGHVNSRYNLGLVRLAARDLQGAVAAYDRAFRADSRQAGYASALHDLREFAEVHQDRIEVQYALAFFFKVIGEYGLETKALEAYLAAGPPGPLFDQAQRRIEEAREKARAQGLLVSTTPSPAPASSPAATR